MVKFKTGTKFINNIDHSKVNTDGYNHSINYTPFCSKPDLSLETIGKIQTVIDIEDDCITTDFILSSGDNYWFERDSPYSNTCEKVK
jgi:hypothetical protein